MPAFRPQASLQLVQLSYTVLERFSQGGESSAPEQQSQQPQQQQRRRSSITSGSSGSWGSKVGAGGLLVPLAPPSVVYTAFAPLVVSTLKVGGALGLTWFPSGAAQGGRCLWCRLCAQGGLAPAGRQSGVLMAQASLCEL